MARHDSVTGSLLLHQRVLAGLGAALVAVAMISVPAVHPPVQVPATASRPAAAPFTAQQVDVAEPAAAESVVTTGDPASLPAAGAPAPPAPAPSPSAPRAPQPVPLTDHVQDRVDEALRTLGYPWRELGWDIRFEPYTGGLLGLADHTTRSITIYVRPRSSVQQLRVVLAHEIGHALDIALPDQRDRYRELRGIPADLPWYPCSRCEDYDSPAGDFAEVFAAWLVGATDFRSRLAPLPDEAQWQQLAPLFAPPSARAAVPPPVQPRPSPSPSPSRSPGLLGIGPRG